MGGWGGGGLRTVGEVGVDASCEIMLLVMYGFIFLSSAPSCSGDWKPYGLKDLV